jgi:hypothetical protein
LKTVARRDRAPARRCATERLKRHEFFARLETLDADRLRSILWKLYYPGASQLRERIEDLLGPRESKGEAVASAVPDAEFLLEEVTDFCRLARSGAYVGGSREVSPSERTRWRHRFRRLVDDAIQCLAPAGFADGARALEQLLDLACEASDVVYFRSEDPVEAVKLVVSDAVAALWKASLEHEGFLQFARRAAPQLLRWERAYGWTRRGDGSVAERERSLASVLRGLLTLPDMWLAFADSYLGALDEASGAWHPGKDREADDRRREERHGRERHTRDLAQWHAALLERLTEGDVGDRLDRLVGHAALEGPEKLFLQARLAHRRGDLPRAQGLATKCLESVPGHEGFFAFAEAVGARIPSQAIEVMRRRGR